MSALDDLLRPAIEVAFVVAVTGARARPPVPPPSALRPYLRLQKLPAAARGPVRRSVEADAEYRERVAAVASEELVGRAGWLWLHRPDGWEVELGELATAAESEQAALAAERDEQRARKRLDAADQARARAAADAAVARNEAEMARAEADNERRARRGLEESVGRLERRAAQLENDLAGARRRLQDAEGRTAEALARASHGEADLGAARQRIAELLSALEDAEGRAALVASGDLSAVGLAPAGAEPAVAGVPAGAAGDGVLASAGTAAGAVLAPAPAGTGVRTRARPGTAAASATGAGPVRAQPVEPDTGPLDRDRLAVVLERAASATAALAEALGDAAALVEPPAPPAPPEPTVASGAPRAVGRRRAERPARPRRTPLPLPGGIMGDSVTAAEHLVKADGVALLVDGYNAAKLAWPGEPLPEQRVRLLDLVDELVMRHGTDTTVVFDGADVACAPPLGRRLTRVTFSPPGTAADDVIVDLVRHLPAERPVVVATNDRAVRAAARSGGANVISSEQLLAVARR